MPAVELVNFTLDAGDIVIRTAASGKLAAAIRGAIVAFEADEYDPATRAGWSGDHRRAGPRGHDASAQRIAALRGRAGGLLCLDDEEGPARPAPCRQKPWARR
jgi:hypothetical protein